MAYIYGTISRGTLRPQDLLPAFIDALREVDDIGYAQLMCMPFGPIPSHAMEDSSADWWTSEECQWMMEDLMDALDRGADEGYYFGAHPGDGSDFGYWESEA